MSDTGKIAEALAAFQAEMPTVPKSHTAKVPTKAGGSYSYTYAGLPDVSEAASPILAKHGLSFSCCPRAGEHGYELHGRLLHSSGEELAGALPIAGNSPQEMGSSLTYMRRYLFGCITGLVTDDDDDGAMAEQAKRKPPTKRPPAPSSADKASPDQVKAISTLAGKLGLTREQKIAGASHHANREVASTNDLTKAEASRVIDALHAKLPADPEATP